MDGSSSKFELPISSRIAADKNVDKKCPRAVADFALRPLVFRVIMLAWANDERRANALCNFYFSMI